MILTGGPVSQLPLAAMDWLAAHHGIIDRSHLAEFGVSANQIQRRLTTGRLLAIHPGVYRSAAWPATELGRCVATCMALPDGAVSHRTAGRLWGLRRCGGDSIDALIPHERRTRITTVQLRRTTAMVPADVVHRPDGIRLTNPVRTVCDLAAVLNEEDLASVIEQVLDEFGVGYVTVRRTAGVLMASGRPGSRRLRAVLLGRPDGAAPQDSHLEVRLLGALVRAGLPQPIRQLPIRLPTGVEVHADLGFPQARLVVEIDHRAWHSGAQGALDKRRDRLVRLAGFDTVRVSEDDLKRRFDETVAEVVAIHDRARRGTVA
jgi:hypothetical protein